MCACSICNVDTSRPIWRRQFPDAHVCPNCWQIPEAASRQLQRNAVAQIIWNAHRELGPEVARRALESLRGKGLPSNPKRGRKHGRSLG